jgi:hypothetical protein
LVRLPHYAGQRASQTPKEAPHAEQKTNTLNVSDPGGRRGDQGISQQGGAVSFHVQQKGVPWIFRSKSGASGGADRQTVHRLLRELDARQREFQQAIAVIK